MEKGTRKKDDKGVALPHRSQILSTSTYDVKFE